ncbi:MAG TPA: hypothetical protein VIN09_05580 [Chloroflexota bacterium]
MSPLRLLGSLVALVLLVASPAALAQGTVGVQDEVARLHRQVAEVRRLPFEHPVAVETIDQERFAEQVRAERSSPSFQEEIETTRKLLELLGYIDDAVDLATLVEALLLEQAVGLYIPAERRVLLVQDAPHIGPLQRVVLAHELTHALQDQHFDLTAIERRVAANADAALAITALAEGDATLTATLFAQAHLPARERAALVGRPSPALDASPPILRRQALFPYREGADFVVELYRRGGFALVNAAYRNPPLATAQVLHPERYLAGRWPERLRLSDIATALGPSWRSLREDTLGELSLQVLLGQFLGPAIGEDAAAGWSGDRYQLLEDDRGRLALVLNTAWDTESDAGDFFNAYARVVRHRFGEAATLVVEAPSLLWWSTPSGVVQMRASGRNVVVAITPDLAAARAVAEE